MSNIVNTPNRLFIRSSDATINTDPARFSVTLREPISGAQGVQLQAARIPNALPQIPYYQRWFSYIIYDWLGVPHYRTFRLGATATASPKYYANYADFVVDLNASAPYWFEVALDSVSEFRKIKSSLYNLGIIAKPPDVEFSYNSTLRKIMVKNVSPAPATSVITITLNENDRFLVRNTSTGAWLYPRIPAGIYTTLADVATAIQAALVDVGVPATITASGDNLSYAVSSLGGQYVIAVNGTDPTGVLNSDQLRAVAPILGQPVPSNVVLQTIPVLSFFTIVFPGTPPPGTLQFTNRADVQQMFVDEEIAGPGLYLNALVGIKTSVRTPAIPLVNDGTTLYEPESWADLLRTQTIYIRTNLCINSTITTNDLRTITDAIPVNAPPLGIISYVASNTTVNWGVPPSINDVDVQLYDENLVPLSLPENAATEFVFSFVFASDRF